MSTIHTSEASRLNYFKHLVVTNILESGKDRRRVATPPALGKDEFSNNNDNSILSPLSSSPSKETLTTYQIPYSHLTGTAYAERLVDELNIVEVK